MSSSYYFKTTPEVVRNSKEKLREKFNLVPANDTHCCQPGKLVWENEKGIGVYIIDFIVLPATVIFRYWTQRYNPDRDGKPMEEAMKFFIQEYTYSEVVDSLNRKLELTFL